MDKILGKDIRAFTFTREAVNQDGTIDVSFSSETDRVERWFGIEVLSHEPGAMDMTRAAQGLPFLINHDCEDLVGRAENIRIEDRKGRATLRFSSSPEAQQIRQDMIDGIRPDISVGYMRLEETTVKGAGNALDVVTVTRWMPYEITTASIPADISVGVGRSLTARDAGEDCTNESCVDPDCSNPTCEGVCSAELKCERCAEQRSTTPGATRSNSTKPADLAGSTKEVPMEPNTTVVASQAAPTGAHLERIESFQLSALANQRGLGKEAAELFASEKPLAEIRATILDLVSKRDGQPSPAPVIDPSAKEMQSYSLVRAINASTSGQKCPEMDISQELGRKMGRDTAGFFMPTNLPDAGQRAGLDSSTATKGAELKYIVPGDFIQLLRNKMLVLKLGAQLYPGLQGNVAFPRQTGAGTAAWLATENPGSDTADSNLLLDQVTLAAKTLLSTTSYSKQLLLQSAVPVEQMVRNDLAAIVALAVDLAAINGSGASGQPKGILNVSGIGSVALGTNGLAIPSITPLVDLETQVALQNADIGTLGYLTTVGQRGVMKKTPAFSTAGALPIWTEGPHGSDLGWVNGYVAGASAQVPSNLTKGTSNGICHAVIFGNFAELLIGEWGALEILTDPFRLKKQAMIELTASYFCDVQVKHSASFAAIKDAL